MGQGASDAFVVSVTRSGALRELRTYGGTESVACRGIVLDDTAIYLAGIFSGTADFGEVQLDSHGDLDAFLFKTGQ